MPYYVGAGEPEWDEYMSMAEDDIEPPISLFKYVEPWTAKATVLHFPETPGAQPRADSAEIARQQLSTRQLFEKYQTKQKFVSELALWKLSSMTARCRANGIKRVFGGYDGGGDESFTHFRSIEMIDGRVISADMIREEAKGINCEQLIEDAAFSLMGRFDAGEYILRGAVVIDFDVCTVTDESDVDAVFGEAEDN